MLIQISAKCPKNRCTVTRIQLGIRKVSGASHIDSIYVSPNGPRWIQMGDPQVCLQRDENRQICDLNDDWGSPITEQHQTEIF